MELNNVVDHNKILFNANKMILTKFGLDTCLALLIFACAAI